MYRHYRRQQQRRRFTVTVIVASILFSIGVNALLAKRDRAQKPATDNFVSKMARDLDARTEETDFVILEAGK